MPALVAGTRARINSVDLLRGLVMVLMALDHTRDFFGASGINPRDVTDPGLFLTRWITHYCAPIFIFLAGMSAYLYGARGRPVGEISRFLLTRGLWLIVIEFTLVRLGWSFSFTSTFFLAQVIWVIGASMVILSALVHLPRWAIATFGVLMVGAHNLLDGVSAEAFGPAAWVWHFLHQPALLQGANATVLALYSLIPWAGVMTIGYALGPIMRLDGPARRALLARLGIAATAGFVLLRATNLYGDPAGWAVQDTWWATVLSFLNCEKYPPSLLYLLMTLGPALMLLSLFENARGRLADWITVFGRVPFLYYVAHIFLIHLLAILFAKVTYGDASWLVGQFPPQKPQGYGLALPGVYAVWLGVVAMLYPLCRWFAAVKQARRDWWLSYL
jgi:uncharacterized membrane protein